MPYGPEITENSLSAPRGPATLTNACTGPNANPKADTKISPTSSPDESKPAHNPWKSKCQICETERVWVNYGRRADKPDEAYIWGTCLAEDTGGMMSVCPKDLSHSVSKESLDTYEFWGPLFYVKDSGTEDVPNRSPETNTESGRKLLDGNSEPNLSVPSPSKPRISI